MNTRISFIDPGEACTGKLFLPGCAELYCKIWREPPWNEYFWKPEDVEKDIVLEISKPSGKCFIALFQDGIETKIVGFTWGYMTNLDYLYEISGSRFFANYCKSFDNIFYVDELGVDSEFRKFGIGNSLSQKLISHAKESGANYLILRTDKKAIPARKLYAQLGFEELPIQDKIHNERTYWILYL